MRKIFNKRTRKNTRKFQTKSPGKTRKHPPIKILPAFEKNTDKKNNRAYRLTKILIIFTCTFLLIQN